MKPFEIAVMAGVALALALAVYAVTKARAVDVKHELLRNDMRTHHSKIPHNLMTMTEFARLEMPIKNLYFDAVLGKLAPSLVKYLNRGYLQTTDKEWEAVQSEVMKAATREAAALDAADAREMLREMRIGSGPKRAVAAKSTKPRSG